jgi:hypothetical protein
MSVVFVFGSNLAGRHGKGAAREAWRNWGAIQGIGVGRTPNSYAIPTKDENLAILPLKEIKKRVENFLDHAIMSPEDQFIVTGIGTGLAGYTPQEIAPMFAGAPENVYITAKFFS